MNNRQNTPNLAISARRSAARLAPTPTPTPTSPVATPADSTPSETYLDYAATAPLLPSVRDAMLEVMDDLARGALGNPSALHSPGQRAKALLEHARAKVASLVNAEPEEIIFTSGGSEANNTVIRTFSGQPIAVSAVEHPSVLVAAQRLASRLTTIPVDQYGFIGLDQSALSDLAASRLISVMLANNELGTIEPVATLIQQLDKISEPATALTRQTDRASRPYFHTDVTQAVGKISVDVKALGVDYLTFSAHKLGGPVGIGALYVRRGVPASVGSPTTPNTQVASVDSATPAVPNASSVPFLPLILGGHQENNRRAGTSNLLLAVGFAAAAQHAKTNLARYDQVAKLRDELRERILAEVPHSSCNSPRQNCLPNILNMSFQAAEGESIQLMLDAAGIAVSTGSACASASLAPSHVLMATRHDPEIAHNSIRFSLGLATTRADVDRVMAVLPGIIKKLQGMSTVKIKEKK